MICKVCGKQVRPETGREKPADICKVCGKEVNEDRGLQEVLSKIEEGTLTCEDINTLIAETTPESIRDRVRRRMKLKTSRTHLDEKGHQKLKLPGFGKRVMPKRKPVNQQNHGRSKIAHKHSAKTQAKNAAVKPYMEAINHIRETIGQPINEQTIKINVPGLLAVALKMMSLPNINRDWLHDLTKYLEAKK